MRIIDGDTAAAFAENCGATFVAKRLRDSNAFPEVVVRCKDCKYCGFCDEATNLEVMGFYGFCSRGKRKDGNNVDDHD